MPKDVGNDGLETAKYIESMLLEPRIMGQKIEADFLVYLIEMAMTEASDIAKKRGTPARPVTTVTSVQDKMSSEQMAALYFEGAFD